MPTVPHKFYGVPGKSVLFFIVISVQEGTYIASEIDNNL